MLRTQVGVSNAAGATSFLIEKPGSPAGSRKPVWTGIGIARCRSEAMMRLMEITPVIA
jgi:hypothetical protein